MTSEATLIEQQARIRMLEAQVEALIKICEKEGILNRDEVEEQVKEFLEGQG